jgi:hypothetical protein
LPGDHSSPLRTRRRRVETADRRRLRARERRPGLVSTSRRDYMAPSPAGTAVGLVVERMKPPVAATLPKQERQLRTRPLSFSSHPPSRTRSVYKSSPSFPESATRPGIRHVPLADATPRLRDHRPEDHDERHLHHAQQAITGFRAAPCPSLRRTLMTQVRGRGDALARAVDERRLSEDRRS